MPTSKEFFQANNTNSGTQTHKQNKTHTKGDNKDECANEGVRGGREEKHQVLICVHTLYSD